MASQALAQSPHLGGVKVTPESPDAAATFNATSLDKLKLRVQLNRQGGAQTQ